MKNEFTLTETRGLFAKLRDDFGLFSYRLAYWTVTLTMGMTILVPSIVALVLVLALLVAFPVDMGNHYLGGSGTLNLSGWVRGVIDTVEMALAAHRGLVLISVLASGAVALTLEKRPLVQMAASVLCIAVQLMLIGALL